MAKKKAGGGILGDIIATFGLLMMAIAAVIPIFIAIAFFAFPIAAIIAYLKTRAILIPKRSTVQPTIGQAALDRCYSQLSDGNAALEEAVGRGRAEGVHFLESENRFERRSRRGQQLNQGIEEIRAMIKDLESKIDQATAPMRSANRDYANAVSSWRRKTALRYAMFASLAAFAIATAAVEVAYAVDKGPVTLPRTNAFEIFKMSIFLAPSVAWMAAFITYFAARAFIDPPGGRQGLR